LAAAVFLLALFSIFPSDRCYLPDKMSDSLGLTLPLGPNSEVAHGHSDDKADDADLSSKRQIEANGDDNDDNVEGESSFPVVSIVLERLVGYQPSSQDVAESIQSQLLDAMWTRYRQQDYCDEMGPTSCGNTSRVVVPPDFDDQIQELFEARIARWGPPPTRESSSSECKKGSEGSNSIPYLVLFYPPKVRNSFSVALEGNKLLDTARAWKEIRRVSKIALPLDDETDRDAAASSDFLSRLFKHLLATSRTLGWKYAMATELRDWIEQELLYKQHQEWVQTQRQAKLDNLYGVRETIVHQMEVARDEYERLRRCRDDRVSQDLLVYQQKQLRQQNRSSHNSCKDGERLLDGFGTSDLNFPEEFQLLGMIPSAHEEYEERYFGEDDWGALDETDYGDYHSSDSDSSGDENEYDGDYDGEGGDDHVAEDEKDGDLPDTSKTIDFEGELPVVTSEDAQEQETNQNSNPVSTPFLRRKERRQRAKERKRKERQEAGRRARLEELKAAEKELREKYTTRELILAQTLLQALEKKVQSVEDLLESLQDEVWAAEEEEEEIRGESKRGMSDSDNAAETSFSLLDQVLAMILGALPVENGVDPGDHYRYVKKEHDAIITGWKNYFGRLPPAMSAKEGERNASDKNMTANRDTPNAERSLTAQEKRTALGIVDNEEDEWDAGDSD